MIDSKTVDRYGLGRNKEATLFAIGTLALPVTGNRGLHSDTTTILDEINNNRSEVY